MRAKAAARPLILLSLCILAVLLSLLWGSSGFYLPKGPIFTLRLMRTSAGVLVGAYLASSGAALQMALRNPLADPYLIGISSGAALGMTGWIIAGLPSELLWLAGFAGGGTAALATIFIAGGTGRFSPATVILAGIAISTFAAALVMLNIVAFLPERYASTLAFLSGQLSLGTAKTLFIALGGGAVTLPFLLLLSRPLEALNAGEDFAFSVGIQPSQILLLTLIVTSVLTALAVAICGIVGFVGLVIPHVVRLTGYRRAFRVIFLSAFTGGAFLTLADTLARSAFPVEVPVGIVTAVIGAPALAYLMWRAVRAQG